MIDPRGLPALFEQIYFLLLKTDLEDNHKKYLRKYLPEYHGLTAGETATATSAMSLPFLFSLPYFRLCSPSTICLPLNYSRPFGVPFTTDSPTITTPFCRPSGYAAW